MHIDFVMCKKRPFVEYQEVRKNLTWGRKPLGGHFGPKQFRGIDTIPGGLLKEH